MLQCRRNSHSVSVPLVDLFGAVLEWASAKGVSGRHEAGGCGQEEPLLGVWWRPLQMLGKTVYGCVLRTGMTTLITGETSVCMCLACIRI